MEDKEKKSIYEMKVGEVNKDNPYMDILRVHNGWIYIFYSFRSIKGSNNKDVYINSTIYVNESH